MDYKLFFDGILFLMIGYFYYRLLLKGTEPSMKENNWTGPSQSLYIGMWGVQIMLILGGVTSIIQSLPSQM